MKSIPFFSDKIKIEVTSATSAAWLDKQVTIAEFAGPLRVSLYEMDNGELMVKRYPDNSFIQGREC